MSTEDILQPLSIARNAMIGSSETTRESPLSYLLEGSSLEGLFRPKRPKRSRRAFSLACSLGSGVPSNNFSFNFDDYVHYHLPEHKKGVDTHFLEWLVGFVEGDGTFCSRLAFVGVRQPPPGIACNGKASEGVAARINCKRRFLFQICQKDPQMLYKIRTELGFGRVHPSGDGDRRHWRYTIEDRAGLQRIMALFNGNLVLPKRRCQFENWVIEAAQIHHPSFVFKPQSFGVSKHRAVASLHFVNKEVLEGPLVSLETGWLSGFIDAEGCLSAAFTTPSARYNLSARLNQRIHLTQQDICGEKRVLDQIGSLLVSQAKASLAKQPNCYRITIGSLDSHTLLVEYLDRFPLRQKSVAYHRWWRVYLLRKEGRHLNERGIRRMRRLCTAINEQNRQADRAKGMMRRELEREGLKI